MLVSVLSIVIEVIGWVIVFLCAGLVGVGMWVFVRAAVGGVRGKRPAKPVPDDPAHVWREFELRGGPKSGLRQALVEPLPAVLTVPLYTYGVGFHFERYVRTSYEANGRVIYRHESEAAQVEGLTREVFRDRRGAGGGS